MTSSATPSRRRSKLGYLPEGAPAYGEMTPREFLHFIAGVRQLSGAAAETATERAVAGTELGAVLDQPIETLSKGFRRRVGLAQAILHDPEVLILDEPTDGLDPNQKHAVRDLIRGMAKDKTIVISTHLLEEVDAICTRAVIIDQGRIVADATPAALAARSPTGRLDDVFRQLTTRDTARRSARHEYARAGLRAGVQVLFRHPAGFRLHRDLPVRDGRLHFLSRPFLRQWRRRSHRLLRLSPLALSLPDAGAGDAAMGGRTPQRDDGIAA